MGEGVANKVIGSDAIIKVRSSKNTRKAKKHGVVNVIFQDPFLPINMSLEANMIAHSISVGAGTEH